jgi:calpain-15
MVKNGVKNSIVLDDFIVCKNSEPAFTRAHGNELWVLLLEKAWAKIHGSFDRIIGGQAHLTMRDLTGAPGYEHVIDKTPDLAARLCNWDQKGYIMAFGLDESKMDSDNLKALGLIAKHSYGVIAAAYVQDGAGNEITLV